MAISSFFLWIQSFQDRLLHESFLISGSYTVTTPRHNPRMDTVSHTNHPHLPRRLHHNHLNHLHLPPPTTLTHPISPQPQSRGNIFAYLHSKSASNFAQLMFDQLVFAVKTKFCNIQFINIIEIKFLSFALFYLRY